MGVFFSPFKSLSVTFSSMWGAFYYVFSPYVGLFSLFESPFATFFSFWGTFFTRGAKQGGGGVSTPPEFWMGG